MPNNTNLGGVFMKDVDGGIQSTSFVTSENVCGIIFDTKIVGGLINALTTEKAREVFANGNVVELNGIKDIAEAGIDETVMCGLVAKHLNDFFAIAGDNQRLFVSFMDSSVDANFEAVELMQLAANGIIYQIGVWTAEPFAKVANGNGDYLINDGGVLSKLQAQAEVLGGKVGVTNYEGNSPVVIIVNAPALDAAVVDYKKLPDLSEVGFEKVALILGQGATDENHAIQLKLATATTATTDSVHYVQVGNVGMALGCLAIASADENIGNVGSFNLSQCCTQCELGFGNMTLNEAKTAFSTPSFGNIKTIGYSKRNSYLHRKGYVFLRDYEDVENGVFFSSDQTLSTGDYRMINRNRIMHKSRRCVRRALLPRVNSMHDVDSSTGYLSATEISIFQDDVLKAIDDNMAGQISGRTCNIEQAQNILKNDKLDITYAIVPKGCTSGIYVTEGFTNSINS